METKHTPGPWETHLGRDGRWRVCPIQARTIPAAICEMLRIENEACYSTAKVRANANLISAAPDLLIALRNMVREWCEIVGDESTNSTPANTLEKARAAIAKAEGGAE